MPTRGSRFLNLDLYHPKSMAKNILRPNYLIHFCVICAVSKAFAKVHNDICTAHKGDVKIFFKELCHDGHQKICNFMLISKIETYLSDKMHLKRENLKKTVKIWT